MTWALTMLTAAWLLLAIWSRFEAVGRIQEWLRDQRIGVGVIAIPVGLALIVAVSRLAKERKPSPEAQTRFDPEVIEELRQLLRLQRGASVSFHPSENLAGRLPVNLPSIASWQPASLLDAVLYDNLSREPLRLSSNDLGWLSPAHAGQSGLVVMAPVTRGRDCQLGVVTSVGGIDASATEAAAQDLASALADIPRLCPGSR